MAPPTASWPPADAHFTYNYQDVLLIYPSYNRTVAYSAYAYSMFTGGDSYLDMQDSSKFEKIGSSNK